MNNIRESKWEAIVDVEAGVVHVMICRIVYSADRYAHTTVIKDTTSSHYGHVDNEAGDM